MKFTQSHLLAFLILTGLWFLPQVSLAQNIIVEGVQGILWQLVVQVLGTFLGLAGVLFDYGINEFVINFGTQYTQNGIGFAVDTTWVVIRDFVNMSFIFGLVYIGMRMILDSDTSSTRRWLVNLIIAALLINFSLFFTKFIVDVSNQFATAIAAQGFQPKTSGSGTGNEVEVSRALMDKLGITNVFFVDVGNTNKPTPGFGYIFGTALLIIIATFVFAAGGILLIIRFAVLNLFFVFSPILFLGLILPPLAGSINKYWKTLISKAFFAPLYLLFIYISFSILDAMKQSGAIQDGENLGGALSGTGREVLNNAENTFPFFILASVLLIASLVVASKLGAEGASNAVSLGKSLSKKAQRGTTRFAANSGKFAAAQTGGRLARAGSNIAGNQLDRNLRRLQQLEGTGRIARITRAAARSNGVQGTVGGAAKSMQDAKFGLKRTIDEEQKMKNQTNTNANNAMAIRSGVNTSEERAKEEERRITAGAAAGTIEVNRGGVTSYVTEDQLTTEEKEARKKQDDAIAKMQSLASDMSIKQFESMSEDEQVAMAQFMSGSLTESAMKSDNISDAQKAKIGDKQKAEVLKSITDENQKIIGENLNNLSIRQIEMLGAEFVAENAALFNDSLFSDIKKSKKFSEGQVGGFVGKRKAALTAMVNDPATAEKAFTQTHRNPDNGQVASKARKASEIAKLPGSVLANPNSVKFLNVDVLKAIASGDREFERVSTEEREKIAQMIIFENDRYLGNNEQFKRAANYIKSVQGQRNFIGSSEQ